MISNTYFAGFIYTLIALNSLLLALDEPQLTDPYQKATITLLLTVISIIFVGECFVKIIVLGFYCGERTYLKDSWNILDFVIVLFSFLTWGLEAFAGSDLQFVRGFRALRALRPLRVVSKNEGIKTVVNALLESIPALLNVLLIVLLFLLVFGILGIQLFKGKMGGCSDKSEAIKNKA
jgi:voltage-dependent calcium channel T type alpha-1G